MNLGIIIEGTKDLEVVMRAFPQASFAITGGTNFGNTTKKQITYLFEISDKVLLLSDPDEAGDRIAKVLVEMFPSIERVAIDPLRARCLVRWQEGIKKYRYGVEYCSWRYIKEVVEQHIS